MTTKHVKVTWVCDICHASFEAEEDAEQCEAQGAFPDLPIGTILREGAYIHGTSLLQILGAQLKRGVGGADAHYNVGTYWTFRDKDLPGMKEGRHPSGDSDVAERPDVQGPDIGGPDWKDTIAVDTNTARYLRAYEAMRAAGKPLYVWARGQAFLATEPGSGVVDNSSGLKLLAVLS